MQFTNQGYSPWLNFVEAYTFADVEVLKLYISENISCMK